LSLPRIALVTPCRAGLALAIQFKYITLTVVMFLVPSQYSPLHFAISNLYSSLSHPIFFFFPYLLPLPLMHAGEPASHGLFYRLFPRRLFSLTAGPHQLLTALTDEGG